MTRMPTDANHSALGVPCEPIRCCSHDGRFAEGEVEHACGKHVLCKRTLRHALSLVSWLRTPLHRGSARNMAQKDSSGFARTSFCWSWRLAGCAHNLPLHKHDLQIRG